MSILIFQVMYAKTGRTIFIIIFISTIVLLITMGSKTEILPVGSNIPRIDIITKNGSDTLESSGNKTMVLFFSEKCPHCRYELNVLDKNIKKLNDINIYLLTADKSFLYGKYIKKHINLLKNDNVTFGIVNKDEYKAKFGILLTPTFYFFDKNGGLTAIIKGETKFERIYQEINNSLRKSSTDGRNAGGKN